MAELESFERGDAPEPDARWAFLGGDTVFDAFAARTKDWSRAQQARLVAQLARASHPRVADVMRAVNNTAAKKWSASVER